THMVDVDFGQIKLFVGNYDFWLESSQLASKLAADQNSKKEEKIKELEAFIARFSANASKSKQATSRKKMLDKITLDDIQTSSRRYPFVGFSPEREIGNDLLRVENISKTIDGKKILGNISFNLSREDKVAFTSMSDIAITTLFKIITGEMEPDTGTYQWGITTKQSYLPKDTTDEFENSHLTILDWLRQYVVNKEENDNTFLRSFLGRMLFSGEEVMKEVSVLSGGEKVRCMLSKLMLSKANVLILDDPTNHLDLESITALNNGLIDFKGAILFGSHDHQFIQTLANRIIEISPNGVVDRSEITYDEFLENKSAQEQITALYQS
ncbi:MAG: ABC-F family ATP-binding cassette domain-containing protein, partial [Alkalibacterium gilvum]